MGKRTWSSPHNTSGAASVADVRRVFKEIHDAIIAGGLVQTSDTGQLANFDDITTTPTAALTNMGFRIYRFADALNEVSPIFIRVNFQFLYSNSSYSMPSFEIAVGTGSNGAGSIAGQIGSYQLIPSGSANLAANMFSPVASFACGGDGFFWMAWKVSFKDGINGTSSPLVRSGQKTTLGWFAIFRQSSPSGDFVPGAIAFVSPLPKQSTGSASGILLDRGVLLRANPNSVIVSSGKICAPYLMDSVPTVGGKLSIGRIHSVGDDGLYATPVIGAVAQGGISTGAVIPVALVGTTERSYISIGPTSVMDDTLPDNFQATCPMLLWEGVNA